MSDGRFDIPMPAQKYIAALSPTVRPHPPSHHQSAQAQCGGGVNLHFQRGRRVASDEGPAVHHIGVLGGCGHNHLSCTKGMEGAGGE